MKLKVRNNGNGSVSRKAQRKAVRKEKKRKRNESWSKSRSHNMGASNDIPPNFPVRTALPRQKTSRVPTYNPVASTSAGWRREDTRQKKITIVRKGKKQHGGSDDSVDSDSSVNDLMPVGKRSLVMDSVLEQEERELNQLRKKLRMKSDVLPRSFRDDGLDYVLGPIDSKVVLRPGSDDSDDDNDVYHHKEMDIASDDGSSRVTRCVRKLPKKVKFLDEAGRCPADEEAKDDGVDGGGDITTESSGKRECSEDDGQGAMIMEEDIFGRYVDNLGRVLPKNKLPNVGYIPPAKRAAMLPTCEDNDAGVQQMRKQMKGLLNKMSEANMKSIVNAVEAFYMRNSRASVNECLFSCVMESIVSPVLVSELITMETAALVAALHCNVGTEVGAYFLQHAVKRWETLRRDGGGGYCEGHSANNIILLLAYLFNFKVAHHVLIFDIMKQMYDTFTDKDVELMLLLLRSAGFYLRRDDPEMLGAQIAEIQRRFQGLESSGESVPLRTRFMLEVLVAIRSNNVRRVPGADVERTDRLKRLAASCVRQGGLAENQLNVSLKDLLHAEEAGRWWIVGSAWQAALSGDDGGEGASSPTIQPSQGSASAGGPGVASGKMLRLAKKLRMNSDVRKRVLFAVMSCEDYEDAFQKVSQLGLNERQWQEVAVVNMACCRQEKSYNPFYAHFLEKVAKQSVGTCAPKRTCKLLEKRGREFRRHIMYCVWDFIKNIGDMKEGTGNMALMLSQLLSSGTLSVEVFKKVHFGALEKWQKRFLVQTFTDLLQRSNDAVSIFDTVAVKEGLRSMADGLRVFLWLHLKKSDSVRRDVLRDVCAALSPQV